MSNGLGSVYQAGNRYVAAVSLPGQKRRVTRSCATREEAERQRVILLGLREQRLLSTSGRQKLAIYLDSWLADKAACHDIRPHTAEVYRGRLDHIAARIGHVGLGDLTPTHVHRFRAELAATGLAPASVNSILTTLRVALNDAVRRELIPRNPAAAVPALKNPRRSIAILPREFYAPLMAHSEGTQWHALWQVLIGCGLRIGEALALHWPDAGGAVLTVRHSITRDPAKTGMQLGPPKTDASSRQVTMPATVTAALERHKKILARIELATRGYRNMSLVFPGRLGGLRNPSTVADAFARHLAAIGAPRITIHALRRTCATYHAMAGTPMVAVRDMLGHSSIRMTADIYTQVEGSMQDEAAARMDAFLRGA